MRNLIYLLFVLNTITLCAQSKKETRLDSLFTAIQNEKSFNGVVLFAENGKVIFKKAYGYSDYSSKEPLTIKSVFDLASVSK